MFGAQIPFGALHSNTHRRRLPLNSHAGNDTARCYRIAPASEIDNVRMGGTAIITQRGLIDSEYDMHLVVGPDGGGSTSSRSSTAVRDAYVLEPVLKAFSAAGGNQIRDVSELRPFVTTPEPQAARAQSRSEK